MVVVRSRTFIVCALVAMSAAVLLSPAEAWAENWVPMPPIEVSAYEFVANVHTAYSMFINPAGMASGKGANMYLDLTGDRDQLSEWVVALQGRTWGVTYRHRDLVPGERASPAPGLGDRRAVLVGIGEEVGRLDESGDRLARRRERLPLNLELPLLVTREVADLVGEAHLDAKRLERRAGLVVGGGSALLLQPGADSTENEIRSVDEDSVVVPSNAMVWPNASASSSRRRA